MSTAAASATPAAAASSPPRFDGGRRALGTALGVGVVGLGLTAARGLGGDGARVALFSYLVAFAYWLGLTLGALLLLMIWHASKARWSVVVRRVVEVLAGAVAIFPLLFLPIAFGLRRIYPWAGPTDGLEAEAAELIHHRAPFLNPSFFLIRAGFYFVVWVLISRLLLVWSTRQDTGGGPELTVKSWKLGAGALPLVAFTLTFAAIDWLMSLGVHWYSSMWGVYYFAGSFVGALALIIILVVLLERTPSLAGVLKTPHYLSLGKFLLAFTCFWAYIAYSQYMLTWIANLPDTIPWLLVRQRQGWQAVGIALIVGHFLVPFFLLLSRPLKMRPTRLALVALWILLIHYVDLYWVVMPQVRPAEPVADWSNLTALVGVGGVTVAFGLFLLRGRHALPVGDPFLDDSLHYEKML